MRKTIFITVLVALIFLLYRGISPSWADKIINKIASIREKDLETSWYGNINTWTLNTWNIVNTWTTSSWANDFEKIVKSGTLLELSWDNKTITWAFIQTWNTNTGNTTKTPVKATTTTKTNTKTSTNTNWLSQQDMKDLENLLNNIVE